MASDRSWTDRRMDLVIGNLLRSGVVLSATIVLFGAVIYLVRHGHSPTEYRVFRGEPSDLRSVRGILRDALALQGRGIIQLGLLFLIATPVARVAFSNLWICRGARPHVRRRRVHRALSFGLQPYRVHLVTRVAATARSQDDQRMNLTSR
jgi:uncharacterized membrane protein